MSDEIKQFEKQMRKHLEIFEEHQQGIYKPRSPKSRPDYIEKGFRVVLNVRNKRFTFLDEQFTTVVPTVSRLEATIEAEKQAREAGWKYIGCVFSVEKVS